MPTDDSSRLIRGIYVIADNSIAPHKSHVEICKSALDGGARIVQLRAKNLSRREFIKLLKAWPMPSK
jgi:thiamine monophosphate synthase